ncbi:GPI-anchored protein LLG1 [Cryptomeria japonica]|uniref:GPI-anchored protein LLG1 n=1 Tax=Cryptomeria japonica TaxID=3369 RepID=UPI0025AC90C5|nr:GPI-anchored protein LLG1 [Cryptomeria japonica]
MSFSTRLNVFFAICQLMLIYLMLIPGPSAAQLDSDNNLLLHGGRERSLLETKKSCPVDFEHQNYTILTSQCKGPDYLPKLCCPAFKKFACKFATYINDLSTDCADIMFSYINLYGKFPPGLFASMCREGKEGLKCNADAPNGSPSD